MVIRFCGSAFGLLLALAVLLRITVFSSVVMEHGAMVPTILPGEFLLATRGDATNPHRGSIVLLTCPEPINRACLKRTAAIAGDRVEFRDGFLFVNEIKFEPSVPAPSGAREPLIVPPGSVYLLNDQVGDDEDSRAWGPVETELIEGQARLIWLSLDWYDHEGVEVRWWPMVRWSRLFHLVR